MVFFSAADPPSRDLECPRAPLAPLCAPQPHIVRTHTDDELVRPRKGANGSPAWRPARRSAVRTPRAAPGAQPATNG